MAACWLRGVLGAGVGLALGIWAGRAFPLGPLGMGSRCQPGRLLGARQGLAWLLYCFVWCDSEGRARRFMGRGPQGGVLIRQHSPGGGGLTGCPGIQLKVTSRGSGRHRWHLPFISPCGPFRSSPSVPSPCKVPWGVISHLLALVVTWPRAAGRSHQGRGSLQVSDTPSFHGRVTRPRRVGVQSRAWCTDSCAH